MKRNLLLAFVLLMPCWVLAQFTVSGKINDALTGKPLNGASVFLGKEKTQSDESGNFSFGNLKAGEYSLKVSFVGFSTFSQRVMLNANKSFNIKLNPSTTITDEVIVRATRASKTSPTAYENLSKEDLAKNNLGQDLPYLLNQTPSVVVSSDAGNGVGYTGIRIRGSDPTRVNVTINGIPYNDPESQGTFWVNLPDFASSVDNIQIQRGVGTSTNGAGAFGGSLNIQTTTRRDSAYAELNNSYGSFNTLKNTVSVGTGLIKEKFTFDGRLSRVKSDGYIDRGSSNLKSYFLSGGYYGEKDLLKINVFSGTEKTYQAWGGVPESMLTINRRYNYFTYDDQTDNYTQNHYQVLYSRILSDKVSFNAAAHYTKGGGYYEEFQEGDSLKNYNISPVTLGSSSIEVSDLIRRRWLDNDFYGVTYSLDFKPDNLLNFTVGGAYNEYDGDHFGEVIWSRYSSDSNIRHRYYDNNGFKTDFNIYGKSNYTFGKANLYVDLQYRRVGYSFLGYDRNLSNVQQKALMNFFNPKLGISYSLNNTSDVYASFAIGNKEPNRDDFTNSSPDSRPKHETLNDIEIGYRKFASRFSGGINAYGMFYQNQLILTGQINDVGEYTRQNVPDSYRVGLELDGAWKVLTNLDWKATASLSSNKIKDFVSFDDNGVATIYEKPSIAFSPSFIGSSELEYNLIRKIKVAFLSKYVGKQYLDNTQNEKHKLDAFFLNDVRLAYNTRVSTIRSIGITVLVNNLFGEVYENNGYVYYGENYYFTQAGRNVLVGLNLNF